MWLCKVSYLVLRHELVEVQIDHKQWPIFPGLSHLVCDLLALEVPFLQDQVFIGDSGNSLLVIHTFKRV